MKILAVVLLAVSAIAKTSSYAAKSAAIANVSSPEIATMTSYSSETFN